MPAGATLPCVCGTRLFGGKRGPESSGRCDDHVVPDGWLGVGDHDDGVADALEGPLHRPSQAADRAPCSASGSPRAAPSRCGRAACSAMLSCRSLSNSSVLAESEPSAVTFKRKATSMTCVGVNMGLPAMSGASRRVPRAGTSPAPRRVVRPIAVDHALRELDVELSELLALVHVLYQHVRPCGRPGAS